MPKRKQDRLFQSAGRHDNRRQCSKASIADSLNSAFGEVFRLRNVAGPDEDPNVSSIGYASPPCYMHELAPVPGEDAQKEKK